MARASEPGKLVDDATPEPRDSSAGLRKKIYCTGPIVTFSHGWPLNADAWGG
jgi:hypothetical protein